LRIGLFGGRFDPVHIAHLIVADYIREELRLDKVILIPAALPPHKKARIDAGLRLDMIKACISDNPSFEISDIELRRDGLSYTIDTVLQFREQYQLDRSGLFWIMGADNIVEFHKWKQPEKIAELCQLVVYPRGSDVAEPGTELFKDAIFLHNAPILNISSTFIREQIGRQRSVHYLVHPSVLKIINKFGLYSVNE
jgi:nicotinate-nucleotide adenylyltransferase